MYVDFLNTNDYRQGWTAAASDQLNQHVELIEDILSKKETPEDMLNRLGQNEYIDTLIVDQLLLETPHEDRMSLEKMLRNRLTNRAYNEISLYSLLDLCIELKMDVLSKDQLVKLLGEYKEEWLVFSLLLEYILVFSVRMEQTLFALLDKEHPEIISIQLLETLFSLHPPEEVQKQILQNDNLYQLYILYVNPKEPANLPTTKELVLLQSMFHGDFEDSGKGNNGGLAVLLKSLGDELAEQETPSFVFTLAIQDAKRKKPLFKEYTKNHMLIRIPLYLETTSKRFVQREGFIKRSVGRLLAKLSLLPDVFHVRYLDNASKAIARLGQQLNKKVVVTLTPDPHRGLFDADGKIKKMSVSEILENANKIKIGDELVAESDAIVGIGETKVKKELEHYFPQLLFPQYQEKLVMISEGIQLDDASTCLTPEEQAMYASALANIPSSFFDKPIMLNVGRLNPVKAQDQLIQAWGNSRLWTEYNLMLIGGDLENPTQEEQEMLAMFDEYLQKNPTRVPFFYHMGALPNKIIRCMEKEIKGLPTSLPPLYVCSSKKEEFGLAILEALSQEFLVIAPQKGGVGTYIQDGLNGFLIDTSNWRTIAADVEQIHAE